MGQVSPQKLLLFWKGTEEDSSDPESPTWPGGLLTTTFVFQGSAAQGPGQRAFTVYLLQVTVTAQ